MATYAYIDNWLTRDGERVLFCDCHDEAKMQALVAEYQANEDAVPTDLIVSPPDPATPYVTAQAFITQYYSSSWLLMCFMWWNSIPHASTPKLASLFGWIMAISTMTTHGMFSYPPPPVAFPELAAECIPLLQQ